MRLGIFGHNQRKSLEAKWRQLYRVAYAWCQDGDLAMDLVQETLTKALDKAHQLRDAKAQSAWLFTILTNCWRDYLRQRVPMDEYVDDNHSGGIRPDEQSSHNELITLLNKNLRRLDVGQREVLVLVAVQGFSYEEVSTILSVPIGTVMSRLSRARKTFRRNLSHLEHSDSDGQTVVRRVK